MTTLRRAAAFATLLATVDRRAYGYRVNKNPIEGVPLDRHISLADTTPPANLVKPHKREESFILPIANSTATRDRGASWNMVKGWLAKPTLINVL